MIETRVRVLGARDGATLVEATEQGGCGACASRSSCGISGLGNYFDGRRKAIEIACDGARPGDEVVVRIAEGDLLKVGLFAYLLPTVLAVIGAGIAHSQDWGDAWAAAIAIAGVALGLALARRFAPKPRIDTSSITLP
jgi:sigma-E factor negative regulatory protein RseC